MRKLLLIIPAILPFILYGQDTDIAEKNISLGISFSPDYGYRTLKSDSSSKWAGDLRDSLEIPRIGFTIGTSMFLKLRKNLSFETGLFYSDKGEQTKKYDLNWGLPSYAFPIKNTFIYHYRYIDVPFKVNFYILTKKIRPFLSAGISTNIFLHQKTISIMEYQDGSTSSYSIREYPGFSRINFAALAGLGIEYDITANFHLRFEPVFRHSITSIIDAPIKSYLYSAGFHTGIFLKI